MASAASQIAESQPLLNQDGLKNLERQASHVSSVEVPDYAPDIETTSGQEAWILLRTSLPVILTYILQYSFSITSSIVVGHIGTKELAAVQIATMTANVTGMAFYEGCASSLDTLCNQAFGAGKKKLVGLQMQRMILFLWLSTIPIGAVWICSPWILVHLIPEREVAILAGSYLRIYLLGAPGWCCFEAAKRYVLAQGFFSAPLFVLLICAPFNVFLAWLFVFHLKLGFLGAAGAVAISNLAQPIVLLLYIAFMAPEALQCWPGMTKDMLRNWSPMIKLAIPGVLMTVTEWLAFDILTFSAAYISTNHLAAQSVLMTISVTMYHIPFPIAVAASTRIGNLIGAGAVKAARVATKTYWCVFLWIGIFDIVLLVCVKDMAPKAFTKDEVVRGIVAATIPVVGCMQFVDATTAFANAVLRGLGRQSLGGYVNLAAFYLYGVPMALFLAFGPPKLELFGLWIGPASALGVISVSEALYTRLISWEKCVDEARSREV